MRKEMFLDNLKSFYDAYSNFETTDVFIEKLMQETHDNRIGDCITYEDNKNVMLSSYHSLCITEADSKNGMPIFLNFCETNLGVKHNNEDIEDCVAVDYTIF